MFAHTTPNEDEDEDPFGPDGLNDDEIASAEWQEFTKQIAEQIADEEKQIVEYIHGQRLVRRMQKRLKKLVPACAR
jgi:hypothetical protein